MMQTFWIWLCTEWRKVGLVLLGLVALGLYWLTQPRVGSTGMVTDEYVSQPVKAEATSQGAPRPQDDVATTVTVDVKGAVKRPGVYTFTEPPRYEAILARAGGATADADLKQVNLAQKASDETLVYIPKVGEVVESMPAPSATGPAGTTPKGPVSLNRASLAELQGITGIGAKRAQDIIDYRNEHGPFKRVEDLQAVRGIGERTVNKLKDQFKVP